MTNEVHDAIERLKSCCLYRFGVYGGCLKTHRKYACAYHEKIGGVFASCNDFLIERDLKIVVNAAMNGGKDEEEHDD